MELKEKQGLLDYVNGEIRSIIRLSESRGGLENQIRNILNDGYHDYDFTEENKIIEQCDEGIDLSKKKIKTMILTGDEYTGDYGRE